MTEQSSSISIKDHHHSSASPKRAPRAQVILLVKIAMIQKTRLGLRMKSRLRKVSMILLLMAWRRMKRMKPRYWEWWRNTRVSYRTLYYTLGQDIHDDDMYNMTNASHDRPLDRLPYTMRALFGSSPSWYPAQLGTAIPLRRHPSTPIIPRSTGGPT